MALPPPLPDVLVVPTRAQLIAQALADVAFRAPNVAVSQGQLANLDAALLADMVLPLYGESVRQAEGVGLDALSGTALEDKAESIGIPRRLPAVGAAGFLVADTSSGGAFITSGTVAKHPQTGAQYRALESKLYANGNPVPVVGLTTGPATNQDAGTVLQWVSPPAGLGPNAKVFTNADGTGLSGGRDQETDEEIRARIRNAAANPAVSGNDAAYQAAAQGTPGLGIEAAFTFPCDQGPGTTSIVATMRPAALGGSRIPNSSQTALIRGWVTGQMAKDDSASYALLVDQPTPVQLRIRWAPGVAKWVDGVPWPPAVSDTLSYIVSYADSPGGSASATTFAIKTATVDAHVNPQAGQSIAFFNRTTLQWVRKTILSVVGGASPWTITVDTSNGASDTAYIPADAEVMSPWSDALQLIVAPLFTYFASLGPGEEINFILHPFFDGGYRQKRSPPSPQYWPSTLTSRMTRGIEDLSAVESISVLSPNLPLDTNAGTVGVSANLISCSALAVFVL